MGKRYTRDEKRFVAKLVTSTLNDGGTIKIAAERLNEIGVPMKSGAKWNENNLSVFRCKNKRVFGQFGNTVKTLTKKRVTTKIATGPSVSVFLIEAIIAEVKSPKQAATLIKTYLEI